MSVQDDATFGGPPQRIRFDPSRRALIVQFDDQVVRRSEADNFKKGPGRYRNRQERSPDTDQFFTSPADIGRRRLGGGPAVQPRKEIA